MCTLGRGLIRVKGREVEWELGWRGGRLERRLERAERKEMDGKRWDGLRKELLLDSIGWGRRGGCKGWKLF